MRIKMLEILGALGGLTTMNVSEFLKFIGKLMDGEFLWNVNELLVIVEKCVEERLIFNLLVQFNCIRKIYNLKESR
jgi:hypothetical protein